MRQDGRLAQQPYLALFIGVALATLTLLVYWRSFDHPFVHYDDPAYVSQNRHVATGLRAENVRWALTAFEVHNWHPLTWLSLQLDAQLYGTRKVTGFHVTNVLLHTANTLLLFLVLGRMTGLVWRSAVVAGLFALHPLHVESVAWVAERKDVLSTLFLMLALAAYLYYVRRPGVLRYLLVVLALVLGLMAKQMLVTLPAVLLLLDYWPLRRWRRSPEAAPATTVPAPPLPERMSFPQLLVEKLPLFAVALAGSVIAFLAQLRSGALTSLESLPLGVRVWNALLAYVAYIGKMLWPMHLAAYYPHPGAAVSVTHALGAGLLLVLITVLVLGPGRRWPYLAVGWLWYLGTLLPVIGLVQISTQGMADRYTYVPLIGLLLLLTWAVADLIRALHLPRFVPAVAGGGVLAACAALTFVQLGYWADDQSLWEHAVAVTADNPFAHCNLAAALMSRGRPERALIECRKAIDIAPETTEAHYHIGVLLLLVGRPTEATAEFQKAVALDPGHAEAHAKLGGCYYQQGLLEAARKEFEGVVTAAPESSRAYADLALVLGDLGRQDEAVAEYRRAIDLDPRSAPCHFNLGVLLLEMGQREEGLAELRLATDLDPQLVQAYSALAQALLEDGQYSEADASLRHALDQLPPNSPGRELLLLQLEHSRYLRALDRRLDAVLESKDRPGGAEEQLELAWLCEQPGRRRYAAAARLYRTALLEQPPDDRLSRQFRYPAVCAAALAGTGAGTDAAEVDDRERSQLRGKALDWIRAELALCVEDSSRARSRENAAALRNLRHWRADPALAGVREPAALGHLPAAEQEAWRTLWREIEAIVTGIGIRGKVAGN
jgi:tetratricopeptide (TPR) repeat protein